MKRAAAFALVLASLSGCALLTGARGPSFDERSFSILNFNLFNQRTPSSLSQKSWKGDWLFRRERLELIDEQLRITRPDIVVMQQVLTRRDSPSESDVNILAAGALEGYEWDSILVQSYKDTQETQFSAAAVGLPAKLMERDVNAKAMWPVGIEGAMSYSLLDLDQDPALLINLEMPPTIQKADTWYAFVKNEVEQLLKTTGVCQERLIVSGHIPGSSIWKGYSDFLTRFRLRDTASGICEAASDCLTSNPQNDLFAVTSNGQAASHSERILVSDIALIHSSRPAMQKMRPSSVNGPQYGIHRLWASPLFGWEAEVRLPKCPDET